MYLKKSASLNHFIVHANHVLDILENTPEAQGELARFGFGLQQLQEGRTLIEQLRVSNQTIGEQKRQQKASTDGFHEQWRAVRRRYQVHLQAARRALGRDADQLLRAAPTAYSEWISHAGNFYQAILNNPSYLSQLNALGLPSEELATGNQMVQGMAQSKTFQTQRRQGVRLATQQREQALAAAKTWFDGLMAVGRVCFRPYPGILEAIRSTTPRSNSKEKDTEIALPPPQVMEPTSMALTTPA